MNGNQNHTDVGLLDILQTLRADMHKSPRHGGPSMHALAGMMGKGYSTLANELGNDGERGTHKLGLLDGLFVMRAIDADETLQAVGKYLNCVFVRLPQVQADSDVTCRNFVRSVKEFGELAASYERAVDPNSPGGCKVCNSELRDLIREGNECVRAILEFVRSVQEAPRGC